MTALTVNLENLLDTFFESDVYEYEHPCDCDDEEEVRPILWHRDTYIDGEHVVSSVVCDECKMNMGSIRFSIEFKQE